MAESVNQFGVFYEVFLFTGSKCPLTSAIQPNNFCCDTPLEISISHERNSPFISTLLRVNDTVQPQLLIADVEGQPGLIALVVRLPVR